MRTAETIPGMRGRGLRRMMEGEFKYVILDTYRDFCKCLNVPLVQYNIFLKLQ
jgi:hypothetical protein